MEALLQDPVFKGLLWSIFAVFGIIVGWLLRAAFPEKKLAQTLERVEQERNTVARLYSQLKRQYEYREADAKKADLELENLRDQVLSLENAQKQRQNQERQLQINTQRAENNARLYQEKVQGLEEATRQLRRRNTEMESEMQRLQAEIESWEQFGSEFNALRQRLLRFEQQALQLDKERQSLRQQLEAARIEVENLQLELLQSRSAATQRQHNAAAADNKGGPASPEQYDDLKIINGISPFAEQQLHALGINAFLQISRWDDEAIIAFAKALGISPGKIYQEDWVGQATLLSSAGHAG